jgi:hypothetical protein
MPSVALILASLIAAGEPGSQSMIVQFPGGHTSVDSKGGVDHVVVQDAKGNMMSESWCDSGRFSDYFALFAKFKDALARGNRDAALTFVHYPFRVNGGTKPLVFKTASSLSKGYAKVFTPGVLARIGKAEPAAVFCRDGHAMIGEGILWANHTGIAILNP